MLAGVFDRRWYARDLAEINASGVIRRRLSCRPGAANNDTAIVPVTVPFE